MAGPTATEPVAWYKADSLSLNDGDPVSSWTDSSANTNDLAQATEANQPTYQTNELNSLPIVRFDGSDILLSPNNADDLSGDLSVFAVISTGTALYQAIIGKHLHGNLSDLGFFASYDLAGKAAILRPWGEAVTSATAAISGADIIGAVVSGTAATYYLGQSTNGSDASFAAGTTRTQPIWVGGQADVGNWFTGDIAEILLYDSALGTEVTDVLDYLYDRWFVPPPPPPPPPAPDPTWEELLARSHQATVGATLLE